MKKPMSAEAKRVFAKKKAAAKGRVQTPKALRNRYKPGEVQVRMVGDPKPESAPARPIQTVKRPDLDPTEPPSARSFPGRPRA